MKKYSLLAGILALVMILTACSSAVEPVQEAVSEPTQPLEVDNSDEALICLPGGDHIAANEIVTKDYDVAQDHYELLLSNIMSGGPGPDGIPPIEDPVFVSIEDLTDNLVDADAVFVMPTKELVYIFPQNILVWHEIVNLEGLNTALTYCPLTGSAIAYEVEEGTSLGTSGSLINSNLLMYDRASNAYISQIDGLALDNDIKGTILNTKPAYWTTWAEAKVRYPEAQILTRSTGHLRDYERDPYGSYTDNPTSNYYTQDMLFFETIHSDEEAVFTSKYPVIGVKIGDNRLALDPAKVKEEGKTPLTVGDYALTALYDETIGAVKVFITDEVIQIDGDEIVADSGLTWDLDGFAISANYDLVSPINYQVMWFAWYAFYPETEVLK